MWILCTCPCISDLRAYIKDVVAYCKEHGLVKKLGLQKSCLRNGSFQPYGIGEIRNTFADTLHVYIYIYIDSVQPKARQIQQEGLEVLCRVRGQGSQKEDLHGVGETPV